MKYKILVFIICCFMLFLVTGCMINKNDFDIGKESNIVITPNKVTLSIKDGSLTKTGAILVLKNNSDVTIQYGYPYEIEIKKYDKWHKINVELNFILPAFSLKTNEIKELELNWENGYGTLASGDYRIIKNIDIEKEDGTYESFYVSAEFSI